MYKGNMVFSGKILCDFSYIDRVLFFRYGEMVKIYRNIFISFRIIVIVLIFFLYKLK